jgi:hypothetical protein
MTPAARRIRRVSDAVVASYIHEISARAGSRATPAPARRRRKSIAPKGATRRRDAQYELAPIASG